jgi:hypothetical protein
MPTEKNEKQVIPWRKRIQRRKAMLSRQTNSFTAPGK